MNAVDWFQIGWGAVATVIFAMGGALWKTMATISDLRKTEQAAKEYTDQVLREALRDFDQRRREDFEDIRRQLEQIRGILLGHRAGER